MRFLILLTLTSVAAQTPVPPQRKEHPKNSEPSEPVAEANGADRKFGYAVTIDGVHGDRHCQFFVLDMKSRTVVKRAEFSGRTRFNMGLSPDGKNLIIHGAGDTQEFYNSQIRQFPKTVEVMDDMTTPPIQMAPAAVTRGGRYRSSGVSP